MTTDRELDALLAARAPVRDADLPALPEAYLNYLTSDEGGISQRAGFWDTVMAPDERADEPVEPASIVAARQLVQDARATGRTRRARGRKVATRVGTGLLALVAACVAAVTVLPAGDQTPPPASQEATSGAGAIDLVAVEQDVFPVSLDPAPAGLTATFSQWDGGGQSGGSTVKTANYRSAAGDEFTVTIYPRDPRGDDAFAGDYDRPQDEPGTYAVTSEGTLEVRGANAEAASGSTTGTADGVAVSSPFAYLLWEHSDDQWVRLLGSGSFADPAELASIAQSLVDVPQPVGLQFGLAPAGWTQTGFEESRSITLTNSADPEQRLGLSLIGREGGATVDTAYDGLPFAYEPERVEINGQPALLALVDDGAEYPNYWILAGQFADPTTPIFLLTASEDLNRDQVLQIAGAVSYTPRASG